MSRQRYGQHFLISPKVLERIASAACGQHAGTVVEIGPGRGALTEVLLPRVDRLIAVEIDPELVLSLAIRFGNEPKLTVIHGDILQQDLAAWSPDAICGNLPYYVATPVLERCVRTGVPVVALIQKEVAERITAAPGSRDYGFLTCKVALFADAKYLFTVKPGVFRPPPLVDSAVVQLLPHSKASAMEVAEESFLHFLSICFAHKRKMLRNNLIAEYPKATLEHLKETSRRAEECSLSELASLFQELNRPEFAM